MDTNRSHRRATVHSGQDTHSAWPCLQLLVVKKIEIVFEIAGAKL